MTERKVEQGEAQILRDRFGTIDVGKLIHDARVFERRAIVEWLRDEAHGHLSPTCHDIRRLATSIESGGHLGETS